MWKELIEKAKKGNQDAWAELYEATRKSAYFVALKVCGKEQDAMDLVQDAYIIAYERLNQLEDSEKFPAWLHMIVANKCRDYLKRSKPALFTEVVSEEDADLDWEDDREYDWPDQMLDRWETVHLVAEMIDGLPEDQKLCVLLYYRDEMSIPEIAQSLQVSEGTVKSRLNYARKKVKAKVEELEKQGTKLYGLAPMPFLAWLLRNEAEMLEVPAYTAAASAAAGRAAEVTGTSTAGNAAAGAGTGTAVGGKAAVSGLGIKIAAGIVTAGLVVGGGVVVHQIQDKAGSDRQMEESAGKTEQSVEEMAYAAYEEFLASWITVRGMEMNYYAYLDLNQDQVPELLVTDNLELSSGELYTYDGSTVVFLKEVGSYYDSYYLVNGAYLSGMYPYGRHYWSMDEEFSVAIFRWNEQLTRNDPAIDYGDGSWEYISKEEFDYYNLLPNEAAEQGITCFAETAEPVELQENMLCKGKSSEGILIDVGAYTLNIPDAWQECFAVETDEDAFWAAFYEKSSMEWGGLLFEIYAYPKGEDHSYLPNYEDLCEIKVDGQLYDLVMLEPTDVQFYPENEKQYLKMQKDIPSIIATLQVKEEYLP